MKKKKSNIDRFLIQKIGNDQYEKNEAFRKKHGISPRWGYNPETGKFQK